MVLTHNQGHKHKTPAQHIIKHNETQYEDKCNGRGHDEHDEV